MCYEYNQLHFLLGNSLLPKRLFYPFSLVAGKEDLETFKLLTSIKENVVDFVDSGKNLYIYGMTPGNGKTSWAIKILQQYLADIHYGNTYEIRGLFISVDKFLFDLKRSFNHPSSDFDLLLSIIDEVDLVVWDDITASNNSVYDNEILLIKIGNRILKGLSNIYTGNFPPSDLIKVVGRRLSSRIDGGSIHAEIVGSDRRRGSGQEWLMRK